MTETMDTDHLHRLTTWDDWDERTTHEIDGIEFELPLRTRNPNRPDLMWQRRVFDDIIPDSPVADASEKILFRILTALTPAQKTQRSIQDALAGQFEPLEDLFHVQISRRNTIPAPFHVLPVKAHASHVNCRIFTERSFLLLMRDREGRLDEELAMAFFERFRQPIKGVDLAQQVLLDRVEPGWDEESSFRINLDEFAEPVPPFLQGACELFQRDLRTLIDVRLSNAEFFETANRVLSLHFGLYLPRLAATLNPAMRALLDELAEEGSADLDAVRAIEDDTRPEHPFLGSIDLRAPSMNQHRRLPRRARAKLAYDRVNGQDLIELHFSLLMLHRFRHLARAYYRHHFEDIDEEGLTRMLRYPSSFLERLQWSGEFRTYLLRAMECLTIKFVHDQLHHGLTNEEAFRLIDASPTGAHALRRMYELYNIQHPSSAKNNRADKSGGGVMRSLLGRGDFGLIQKRSGVGSYFEVGAGLLPLLLTLAIGAHREKIKIEEFWEQLSRYGFSFAADDRELLLQRFKAMGLYERFSDAGEANYIRNPMVNA